MFNFVNKWFGGGFNARMVTQYRKIVDLINKHESKISALSDKDLANKTLEFKELLANGKTLDDILPETFAVVREASKRVLGMRHFDVQLIGGIALHEGKIAEMRTGEGKTLVATSPVYLNALSGKGVHVVTVNDYLAKRDGEQMGQVYGFLGLTTSVIVSGMSDFKKKEAYAADITYGTNHEFGFDYLRDNLKFRVEDMVMRPFNYALVDEVDSILIDEARTPLIISGPDDNASQMYVDVNSVVKDITEEDYEKDAKTRAINLTEAGIAKIEKKLMDKGLIDSPLYDSSNVSMVYYVNCALKANKLFKRDVDYMVKNGQILIIDEFTGRAMEGRRYSEGLHQALEAKEGVEVQAESQTIASISYQNLFRMYPKLSGMTGTAMTEEAEFDEIYKLKVVTIPTNKPVIRKDHEDSIFLTMEEKDKAVVKLIKECYLRKQPVLVGTTNLDRSEYISFLLTKEGVKHNVLNAKQHEREAIIISEAGAPGAVTIATNMAGRGTDIKLGGSVETRIALECNDIEDPIEREEKINQIKAEVKRKHDEVIQLGGLFVVGTERNESRRIDNQLRGRSGRQGDPGASKYFLSLEDDLIKRFGSPNLKNMLKKLGVKKDEDLTHRWISKAIEKAQQRVEAYNFDIRKHLLKYDDVMNEQRKMIYSQRLNLMKSEDLSEYVENIIFDTVDNLCEAYTSPEAVPFEWKLEELQKQLQHIFDIQIDTNEIANDPNMTYELLKQQLHDKVKEKFNEIKESIDIDYLKGYEKDLTLRTLDNGWKKHLVTLEHLRRGINLQSYAQKNPLNEYKFAAFNIFDEMLNGVRKEIATSVMHLQPQNAQSFGNDDFDTDFSNFDFNEDETDPKERLRKLLEQWKQIEPNNIPVYEGNNEIETDSTNNSTNEYNDQIEEDEKSTEDSEDSYNDDIDAPEDSEQSEEYPEHSEENIENGYDADVEDLEDNNNNTIDKEIQQPDLIYNPSISRNSPCPCGSGLKYKECHGKIQQIIFNSSTDNQDSNTTIEENNNNEIQENNIEELYNNINQEYDNISEKFYDIDENTEQEEPSINNEPDEQTDTYSENNKDYAHRTYADSERSNEYEHRTDADSERSDEYETPQEILRKFAKDQRDAIFGNTTIDTNDEIQEDNKEIDNSIDTEDSNATNLQYIKEAINTVANNNEEKETKKPRRRSKKIDNNDTTLVLPIENNANILQEDVSTSEEEPVVKKKVTRKKKVLQDNTSSTETIVKPSTKKKKLINKDIEEDLSTTAEVEPDNNDNVVVKPKKTRVKKNKIEENIDNKETKKVTRTRKVKDNIDKNSSNKDISKQVQNNNVEDVDDDIEVIKNKYKIRKNKKDINTDVETDNEETIQKPRNTRRKTIKE